MIKIHKKASFPYGKEAINGLFPVFYAPLTMLSNRSLTSTIQSGSFFIA